MCEHIEQWNYERHVHLVVSHRETIAQAIRTKRDKGNVLAIKVTATLA